MLKSAKCFIYNSRSWIILALIVFFNVAAFYSCIRILHQEKLTISSYQQKNAQTQNLDNLFADLQTEIMAYFHGDAPDKADVDNISRAFSELQNAFIFFDQENGDQAGYNSAEEIRIIHDIQESISEMVPYIRQVAEGGEGDLHEEILRHISKVGERLREFSNYQTAIEEQYLSEAALKQRRTSILISVSILGMSSLFLILFLVYKNNELERIGEKQQKKFDLADQRVQAIEASNDGIAIMGPDKKLLYMNKALGDLHGIPEDERESYIGKDWKELYNDKGKAHIEGYVYPFLYNLGEWRGESRIMRKDGKVIEAELSLTVLPGESGLIGTARDITHRRQAEQENRELQGQIHQAQKMEAVGRLAGGVAHDFNNILAAIMGYAEFLSEDLEHDPKLKKFADNILMAGKKGRGLIDQMLTFSRRKESQMSVVDLQAAIDETISMISAGLPKSIELNVDYHHDKAAYINGDASQVSQALMNIVVNAVDAMEDEKGQLDISLSLIEPDEDTFEGMIHYDFLPKTEMPPIHIQSVEGGHANLEMGKLKRDQPYFQISISDTGNGIAEAVMEHIFEPFFTTKSVEKGTGLGMANVHGAVVAHHGAMIIDSVLMEGTTFDLFFPQAEYIDDISLLNEGDQSGSRMIDFAGIRILLVDDQADVLSMMETLLTRSGFECVSKSSSLDALEYLREAADAFDMVITDQNMPKMTGVELAEQCLQINSKLPFVIISGYSHEKLQEMRMTYSNIKATIRKPAKKETVLKAIDNVLKETI